MYNKRVSTNQIPTPNPHTNPARPTPDAPHPQLNDAYPTNNLHIPPTQPRNKNATRDPPLPRTCNRPTYLPNTPSTPHHKPTSTHTTTPHTTGQSTTRHNPLNPPPP